jgi:hypothetical protein
LVSTADTSGVLQLQTNGTTAVTVDASQRVGVGTTSPSRLLHLNAALPILQFTNPTTGTTANDGTLLYQSGANFTIEQQDSGYINVVTGGTERARIDSSGNLLVGVSTFTANTTKFVSSTSAVGSAITAQNTSGSNNNDVVLVRADRNTTNGTFTAISYYNDGAAAYKFRVFDSGNVVNTNNSYGAISDAKLKENVTDANPKLEKLQQVRVVNYNLIGSEQKQIGVIAQELEQIFPSMVEESPDRDKEGNDLGTKTKSVKYSVFVPMLIKAIQEQQALIESLKARLDAANL